MTSLAVFGQEAVDNGERWCPRPVEFVICQMQTAQISAMPDGDLSERPAWPEMNACNEGQHQINRNTIFLWLFARYFFVLPRQLLVFLCAYNKNALKVLSSLGSLIHFVFHSMQMQL